MKNTLREALVNVSGDYQFYRANVIFENILRSHKKYSITTLFVVKLSCSLWNGINVWGQSYIYMEMERKHYLSGFYTYSRGAMAVEGQNWAF